MSDSPLPDITPKALDIQHDTDPAQDHGIARRIPHLGHTALFLSITIFFCIVAILAAVAFVHGLTDMPAHPFAAALGQVAGYLLTLLVAVPVFPLIWRASFWQGIHWTWRPARLNAWKLLVAGVLLSILAQIGEHFFTAPTQTDIVKLFSTPLAAWLTASLGTFIPTFFEEILFRGFLMTSLAIAYDWIAFPRTPAGLDRWQRTNTITQPAWAFGAILSSLAFAAMHGFQLHGSLGPLIVLFFVSLFLSFVRYRTGSVAASWLVHMAYDAFIFIEMMAATGGFRHLDKLQ